VADDVILNKAEIIENCLLRIREIYDGSPANLTDNLLKQESLILNLERLCQAAIDISLRIVRKSKLGLPKESAEAFQLLEKAQVLTALQCTRLKKMVGFRNIAVHDYQALDLNIVRSILEKELDIFPEFIKIAIQYKN